MATAATERPSTTTAASASQGSSSSSEGAAPAAAAASGGLTEVLARKAKKAEVEAFKAALPPGHPLFTELDKVGG